MMKTVFGLILGVITMSLAIYYVNIEDYKPEKFQLTEDLRNREFYQELLIARQQKSDKDQYIGEWLINKNELILTGYYKDDSCEKWTGKWLNKNGISSKREFLISPLVQELLVKSLSKYYLKNIEYYRLGGFNIPNAGIVAAMHIYGSAVTIDYLYNNKHNPEMQQIIDKFSKLNLEEISNEEFGKLDSLRQLYQETFCQ